MKYKKSLSLIGLAASSVMILAACGNKEETPTTEEKPIVLKQQQEVGTNDSKLDNDTNYKGSVSGGSAGGSGTASSTPSEEVDLNDKDAVIDAGGSALVESGIVSKEDKLMSEEYMATMSKDAIMLLRGAYGENRELAGDADAIYKYLSQLFDYQNKEDLKELATLFAKESNTPDRYISISHNIQSVKQLSDTVFAVYFYVRAEYKNENGDVIDKLESPYHIMTLKESKDSYKVVRLSISPDSYIKYEDE